MSTGTILLIWSSSCSEALVGFEAADFYGTGYYGGGGLALVIVILLILVVLGRI